MPIILTDTHTCEKCRKVFEWNYFEIKRQNINSPEFKPEPIPYHKTWPIIATREMLVFMIFRLIVLIKWSEKGNDCICKC